MGMDIFWPHKQNVVTQQCQFRYKPNHWRLLGKRVKCNPFFKFIPSPFTQGIQGRCKADPSTDFHVWWLKRLVLAQGCVFWEFANIAPIKGVKSPPQQLNFGGVIRRFKPNVQTIKTFILSQRLHIFQPNFEQNITRSSAIAEGPRDASCQLKSCQLPRNSAETTYTTSPDQIDGMKLEI